MHCVHVSVQCSSNGMEGKDWQCCLNVYMYEMSDVHLLLFGFFFRIYLNEFIPALHCVPPPCCRAVPCSTSRGVRCGSSTILKENNIVKQNKMFFCLSELRLTCCWVKKTKKKEERKEKINPTVCIVQKSGIENTPAFCSFQFEI